MVQPFFRRKKIFERRRKIFKRAEFKNFKNRERKIFEKFFFKVCCDYHSVFGLGFAVLDAYIRVRVRVRKQKNAGK